MSDCFVFGARKRIHASKAFPERKHSPLRPWQNQGLGWSVVGMRTKKIEGTRPCCRRAKKRGRSTNGPYPESAERGGRPRSAPHLYIQRLFGGRFSSTVQAEVEGVHPNDH